LLTSISRLYLPYNGAFGSSIFRKSLKTPISLPVNINVMFLKLSIAHAIIPSILSLLAYLKYCVSSNVIINLVLFLLHYRFISSRKSEKLISACVSTSIPSSDT